MAPWVIIVFIKHFCLHVLFISYKFVKGFLAITFLLLVISSWNFQDVCQRFYTPRNKISAWSGQITKNFPIDPHQKNRQLFLCHVWHDVTKVGDFYNRGLWGKSLSFVGWSWNFVSAWHTPWKFQLEITSSKKDIAKKPLTNLYEMNSRFLQYRMFLYCFSHCCLFFACPFTCTMYFDIR